MLTVEVLPPRITNTEVDNCNSFSGLKTQRLKKEVVDTVGFISRNEDTQCLCCPRVWDKSFSEHLDVETELSRWVETEHSNTCLDINIHSSTNNRDDGLFRIVTLTSVINNPEVDNVNLNSGLKAQRKIK